MSTQPPPGWKPPDDWLPPPPGRNLTPYALGAIGVLFVSALVGVVRPSLALLLIFVVVWIMASRRKREKQERFDAEMRQWYAQNPNPQQHAATPPPMPPAKSGWSIAGTALAAIAAVGGLMMLAGLVVLFVIVSSGGFKLGNK